MPYLSLDMGGLAMAVVLVGAATPEEIAFKKLLDSANLIYRAPIGMSEAPVLANAAVAYQWALRNAEQTVELRVWVRPQAPKATPPAARGSGVIAKLAAEGSEADDPAFGLGMSVLSTVMALTKGANDGLQRDVPAAPFKADHAITATFVPRAEGWNAKKRCVLFAVRKRGAADVYVFFLFDDPSVAQAALSQALPLVTFK